MLFMFYVKDNMEFNFYDYTEPKKYAIISTNIRIVINTSILTNRGRRHTSEVSEPFTESSV